MMALREVDEQEAVMSDEVAASGRAPSDFADGSRIGFVHSAETTSGVNGPGLRYTVFLSGCPLRCLYCHNPDTQTMRLGERTSARHVIEEAGRYRAFISHGKKNTIFLLTKAHKNRFPLGCEFYGIRDQVIENLGDINPVKPG